VSTATILPCPCLKHQEKMRSNQQRLLCSCLNSRVLTLSPALFGQASRSPEATIRYQRLESSQRHLLQTGDDGTGKRWNRTSLLAAALSASCRDGAGGAEP